MIQLFTKEEFDQAKSVDLLPLKCEHCGKTFYITKKMIKFSMKNPSKVSCRFCSIQCAQLSHKKRITTNCEHCGKEIEIKNAIYKKSKSKHFFLL